jgi:hypothetical protein
LAPSDAQKRYGLRPGHGRDYVETDVDASRVMTVNNPRTGKPELQIVGDVPLINPTFVRRM